MRRPLRCYKSDEVDNQNHLSLHPTEGIHLKQGDARRKGDHRVGRDQETVSNHPDAVAQQDRTRTNVRRRQNRHVHGPRCGVVPARQAGARGL